MGTHPIFESDFDCLTELKKMSVDKVAKRSLLKPRRRAQRIWMRMMSPINKKCAKKRRKWLRRRRRLAARDLSLLVASRNLARNKQFQFTVNHISLTLIKTVILKKE